VVVSEEVILIPSGRWCGGWVGWLCDWSGRVFGLARSLDAWYVFGTGLAWEKLIGRPPDRRLDDVGAVG